MKRTGVLILLLLLLLGSLFGNYYFMTESESAHKSELSALDSFKQTAIIRDSLLRELEILQEQLNIVWEENQLGVDKIVGLEEEHLQMNKTISYLRRQLLNANTTVNVDSFKSKIATLEQEKQILASENLTYSEKSHKLDSLNRLLSNENDELLVKNQTLDKKLERGQKPNFSSLVIKPVRDKKGEILLESRARKVEYLQIRLTMFNNPITDRNIGVPLRIRIIDPEGAIINKDKKTLTDKSKIFTIEEEISFDGGEKKMSWDYRHNSDFVKGLYKFELLSGDNMIQVGSFELE
jgi:hypothetical protein